METIIWQGIEYTPEQFRAMRDRTLKRIAREKASLPAKYKCKKRFYCLSEKKKGT